jgi:putative ABC transport system permease protein
MDFIPILSTLRRHKTAAMLIVLEIAFTCAIVCNAIFLIRERLARMDRPSGVVEDELVHVRLTGIGTRADANALTAQDLVALRAIPGVKSAAVANMIPFGNSSWNNNISTIPDDPNGLNASFYIGCADLVSTLGVRFEAGRDFEPGEFADMDGLQKGTAKVSSIILTHDLAERLFHGENPLGKHVYVLGADTEPQTVVGVIDRLLRPNDFGKPENAYLAMILPVKVPYTAGGQYILRVDPERRDSVLAAVDETLTKVDNARIILGHGTLGELRHKYYDKDRSMAYLLVGVSIALLIITALGVVGLASFWVQQRTRQIGIRRALGATRANIVRYFQVENFILATAGIVLGMALAYAINLWLMTKYQVPRLPAEFLPIGAGLLWVLGQIAVLGPAMRASLIPPAVATRSV